MYVSSFFFLFLGNTILSSKLKALMGIHQEFSAFRWGPFIIFHPSSVPHTLGWLGHGFLFPNCMFYVPSHCNSSIHFDSDINGITPKLHNWIGVSVIVFSMLIEREDWAWVVCLFSSINKIYILSFNIFFC